MEPLAEGHQRRTPPEATLGDPSWSYVDCRGIDDLGAADWRLMDPQRDAFFEDRQADLVLELFETGRHLPSWGYRVNTYYHGLQAATLCYEAGYDAEDVVVALLHDVGLSLAPMRHGQFAAELLHEHISDRNVWLLRNHNDFVMYHCHGYGSDELLNLRDAHRDHEHYDWGVEFAARFDAPSIDPDYPTLPVEAFEPALRDVFGTASNTDS